MDRYIHRGDGAIIHCPGCRGVIIKSLELNKECFGISFVTHCQHCQKVVSVKIILKPGEKSPEIIVEDYKA